MLTSQVPAQQGAFQVPAVPTLFATRAGGRAKTRFEHAARAHSRHHPPSAKAGWDEGHTSAVPVSWTRRLESWPALSETELIPHHKLTGAKQLAINTIQSLGTRWGEERGEEHRPVDGRSLMTGLPRGGASGRPGCSTKPTHILRLDLGVCAPRMRGLRETMREKWPTSPSSPSDNTNESRGIRTRVQ